MADDDKAPPPRDLHPLARGRPSIGPRGMYLRPRRTDRAALGPSPDPGQPMGPPPLTRTGPRVRVSCRRAPPPQAKSASKGPSSSSSFPGATMLANIERDIPSSLSSPPSMTTAAPRELELPQLVISDSCLSIQQHLSQSLPTRTTAEDANPNLVQISESTSQIPTWNSRENKNPNRKDGE